MGLAPYFFFYIFIKTLLKKGLKMYYFVFEVGGGGGEFKKPQMVKNYSIASKIVENTGFRPQLASSCTHRQLYQPRWFLSIGCDDFIAQSFFSQTKANPNRDIS